MSNLRLLSVSEDDDAIDRISAEIKYDDPRYLLPVHVRISVHGTSSITMDCIRDVPVDLDELIEFLQDAKEFIKERQLMNTLAGKIK